MMCISDLNPQMQFRPFNTEEYRKISSKIINIPIGIDHKEPALETPTGTPHLAATRPPRAGRAVTENWLTSSGTTPWATSLEIWSKSHYESTQTTSWRTPTTIHELGVTRSYEEDPNIIIHRFEVEAL